MKRFFGEILVTGLVALAISPFTQIPFWSWFSLIYAVVLVVGLLDVMGKRLPFKELITSIMGVQLLAAPYLEYYVFQMRTIGGMSIPDAKYYAFALPCTILLNLGLSLMYPVNKLESNLFSIYSRRRPHMEKLGIMLIIVGYLGHGMALAFKLVQFDFFIFLLSFARLMGFMYLWMSGSKLTKWAFILVVIPFALEAINATILVNLIVYTAMLMSVYFMKHQTPKFKIYIIFLASIMLLGLVQSVKQGVRKTIRKDSYEGSRTALFIKNAGEQLTNMNSDNLRMLGGAVNVRVNQGWILSDVIHNMQKKDDKIKPLYFKREMLGVLFPRIIYPQKPVVGDHDKFKELTGWQLNKKVAMSVGLMGDGFGNFGWWGGMIYCFAFGLGLGYIFKLWNKLSFKYPTLIIWGILIFFYTMRAGDETYIILNWTVKASIFVFAYFFFFEKNNVMSRFINRPMTTPIAT